MITLTAEVICDRCKTPIASGDAQSLLQQHVRKQHAIAAIVSAEAAARAKGAIVGLVAAWCADLRVVRERPEKTMSNDRRNFIL